MSGAAEKGARGFEDEVREAQEALAKAAQISGLTNDPMLPVLAAQHAFLGVTQSVIAAVREAAGTGARGLTPDGERDLIAGIANRAGQAVHTLGKRITNSMLAWAVVCGVAVCAVAGGTGFLVGRWTANESADIRRSLLPDAPFWAQIVELNNASGVRAYCFTHATQPDPTTLIRSANCQKSGSGHLRLLLHQLRLRRANLLN